jgi:hypothetical protein
MLLITMFVAVLCHSLKRTEGLEHGHGHGHGMGMAWQV